MAIQGKKASELPVMASAAGSSFYGFDNTTATGSKRALGGGANGLGTLDASAKQPSSQMPLYTANFAGAVPRSYSNKNDETPSVLDFGADPTGVANSFAAFTAAAAVGERVLIPEGTYNLSANVSGQWEIDAGVTFTGAGRIVTATRGYWTDVSPGVNLHRLKDRVFVGGAADVNGADNPGADKTWVGFSSAGLMTYFETRAQMPVFSQYGAMAISTASRSSDQLAQGGPCIGVGAFARNDKATANAWALYGTAVKDNDTVASTLAIEVDIANRGSVVDIQPYAMTEAGMTVCAWIRSGGETAESSQTAFAASAAIGIVGTVTSDPTAIFRKGIVFQANALDVDTEGRSPAIVLAKNHKIEWILDGAGAKSGEIRSDATTSTNQLRQVFNNSGCSFFSWDGSAEREALRIMGNPTSANFFEIRTANAGGRPTILPQGTDTNIDMALAGKGTGGVRLRDGASAERFQVNTTGIGYFGTTPVAKQTVTGSRGGNAALTSLLDALNAYGFILNSTTA